MSNKRIGPKRRKGGSGMIGMGRGDLFQTGGSISRKMPPTEVVQGTGGRVGFKTVKVDRAAASFASRLWGNEVLGFYDELKGDAFWRRGYFGFGSS